MTYSELKILFESLETKEHVRNALESIKQGYVSVSDIESSDYLCYNNRYYDISNWCVTGCGNVYHIDDCHYCDQTDEYWHHDDISRCYMGRFEYHYNTEWADRNLRYYDGAYYDEEALDRQDIVWAEDLDELCHRDDLYYHEGEGCYYSYPEEEREEYTRGYHDGGYRELIFSGKSNYRIGYEIEKEDVDVLESIPIDDFEESTGHKWRKERDGSLDSSSGYELISPTFELSINDIFKHINNNNILVKHINADISTRCGGHINLSDTNLTGSELFDKIKGYTPLFYALYYGRVDKNYCKGKNNKDLADENEKYQAIKIHSNRIEFRIISAVPNVNTLKWRTKLISMILKYPTDNVIQAYYNVDTKFTKLLKETYSDDRLIELKNRFINYTKRFEGLDIKNNN